MTTSCLVTQRLGVYASDGPDDADSQPDWVPISGKVKFVPNVRSGDSFTVTDESGEKTVPAVIYVAEIRAGILYHNDEVGIRLFAAGPNSNPKKITYKAQYFGLTANAVPITLRDVVFEAIPGGEIDLTTVTPVAGTPAMGITRGAPGPAPYIGNNGNWWVDNKDLGVAVTGPEGYPGVAPYIKNGNWWVKETDLGVSASGPQGDKGDPGPTGTLDLIDESVQTTIDTVAIPAIEGARDDALGQVAGAVDAEISEHLDSKADKDDPRLPLIMRGEYAAVIGDGDYAALAVTQDGAVDFWRATPGTREAIMGSPDAVQASQGGDDHYVFQVSDRDGNVALAIDRSGAVDFRRATPEVEEYLRAIIPQGPGTPTDPTPTPEPEPGGSSRDVWIPDVDGTALHATHLDTGKRVLLSTTTTESSPVGNAILWDEAGTQMYQKHPDEPAWRATDRTRIAFWGSSSIQESHGQLAAMASSFGITDVMRGGLGSDRGRHILGRMGAAPFTLAHDIVIPASGTVDFDTTNGTPLNLPALWGQGKLGGVVGQLTHRGVRYSFARAVDGDPIPVGAGTQFIPDSVAYRDAPAILQIGKNDISAEGAGGEIVLEQTETAYQWLRTLPEWVAVLGHHVNSNWAGDSDLALSVKTANDLCRDRYQERFIDLQAYLSSAEVWDHTGLTPTQEDLDRQAAGVMPLAFSRDTGAHMNDTAKVAYVNHLIIPHLNQIGWF